MNRNGRANVARQNQEQKQPQQQIEEDPVFNAILSKAGGDLAKMQRLLEEDLDLLFEDSEIRALLLGEKKAQKEDKGSSGGGGSADPLSHYSRDGAEEHEVDGENDDDGDWEEQDEDTVEVEEKLPKKKGKEQSVSAASSAGWWGIYTGIREVYYTLFSPDVLVEDILEKFEAKESREMEWKRRAAAMKPCRLLSGRRGLKNRGKSPSDKGHLHHDTARLAS